MNVLNSEDRKLYREVFPSLNYYSVNPQTIISKLQTKPQQRTHTFFEKSEANFVASEVWLDQGRWQHLMANSAITNLPNSPVSVS